MVQADKAGVDGVGDAGKMRQFHLGYIFILFF